MTEAFRNMSREEAERFMAGNDHPMREVAAGMVGDRFVVDLGCGRGIKVNELYTKEQYCGIDCSNELIKIARKANPKYSFHTCEIQEFLASQAYKDMSVGLMISVFEHVESLQIAQDLYYEASRACKELLVGWHCPPHYSKTSIIQVQAELNSPIYQNHYAEGSFHGAVRVIPVRGGELWSVRG